MKTGIITSKLMWAVVMASACTGTDATVVDMESSVVAPAPEADQCDYPQVFGTAVHTGSACKEQRGLKVVAALPQDPDADEELAQVGFLSVHESPALTQGDFVVIPGKANFTNIFDRTAQTWNVTSYKWSPSVSAPNATLVKGWKFQSDWQPTESLTGAFSYAAGYEPLFSPVLTSASVYVPAKSGRLQRLNLTTGAVTATINPFAGTPFDGDAKTIINNALSIDSHGNVYYTVTAYPLVDNVSVQPRGAWLVKVKPDNTFQVANWATIASPSVGVDGPTAQCDWPFGTAGTPAATGPTSQPPRFGCGTQRPATNSPITIDEERHRLVAYSFANNALWAAYVITINDTTLAPIAAFDTRGRLTHGCGRRLSITDYPGCDVITAHGTTNLGVDPGFNRPVPFFGGDLMDNAPWVAPNGDVGMANYDSGFQFEGPGGYDARGASMVFDSAGALAAKNEEYGWQVTPTVVKHADGTFDYLQDRNLFSDFELTLGLYSKTFSLKQDENIAPSVDINGDFVDTNIPVDTTGRHYAMNGDGTFRAFDSTGKEVDHVTIRNADSTPRSLPALAGYNARDRAGRIYVSYAGSVYVIAGSGVDAGPAPALVTRSAVLAGQKAKYAGMRGAKRPEPPAE